MLPAETLLAPIPGEHPAGESLRFDPLYDEIKRLREEEDASLPQGIWQRELKRADWPAVAATCSEALTARTKDLQIAAWLTEAWIHLHGYRGLAAGLRVLSALCREYWDVLYPPLEVDDSDGRLAPVIWTVEKLVYPIKSIRVTAPVAEDASAYGWKEWESALHSTRMAKGDVAAAASAAEQRGEVSQPKFLVSVSLTPAPWLVTLAGEVHDALTALAELEQVLIEKCGMHDAPSVAPTRDVLTAVQGFISRVVQERVEKGELMVTSAAPPLSMVPSTDAATSDDATTESHPVQSRVAGVIASRAEAYQALREASDFLMRTEPHSPVPYLVRRAISWGNLSLAELLEELLQKNSDVSAIYALLGMKKEAGMK
jgi:type VI secretion system ImpA family protein